jgi:flagellar motor switch protein FliG
MEPKQAAWLLTSLPVEDRPEIVHRMATIDQISPAVVRRIQESLNRKLKTMGSGQKVPSGGLKSTAQLCNCLDGSEADQLLSDLDQINADLATEIRNQMFVFEDLLKLSPETLKEIFPKLDRRNVLLALKGSSEKLREMVFSTMPKRAASMMQEELESLGPTKISTVETAQRELIEAMRDMEREGLISLRGEAGEQYIR